MRHEIKLEKGKSVLLPTAGKYVDRDIFVVTSEDGATCSCVLEVKELPTENIKKDSIYAIVDEKESQFYISGEQVGGAMSVVDFLNLMGANATVNTYVVEELPSDMLQSAEDLSLLHLYILEDSGIAYINNGGQVITFGTIFGIPTEWEHGWADSIDDMEVPSGETIYFYTIRGGKQIVEFYKWQNGEWVVYKQSKFEEVLELPQYGNKDIIYGVLSANVYDLRDGQSPVKFDGEVILVDTVPNTPKEGDNATLYLDQKTGIVWMVSKNGTKQTLAQFNKALNKLQVYVDGGWVNSADSIVGKLQGCYCVRKYKFYLWDGTQFVEQGGSDDGEDPVKYLEAQHETVDLPNATAIKPYAFYLDAVIRSINAPKVTTIGKYAFSGCEKFRMTTLPDTIETIGTYGFKACGSMALERLPSALKVLEEAAFHSCNKMTVSEMPSGVTTIGKQAFYNCTRLALTSLPDGVTSIGESAFNGCGSITISKLPDGLTSIGQYAFQGCGLITIDSIPEGISTIDRYCFSACESIKKMTFPETLQYLYNYAFGSCTSLQEVYFARKPLTLQVNAFYGCTNITDIYVPWAEGAVANAPWGATNATIHYNSVSN